MKLDNVTLAKILIDDAVKNGVRNVEVDLLTENQSNVIPVTGYYFNRE